jgi:hypothetical protein
VICNRSPDVLKVVPMAAKTSGDSTGRVSEIIFRQIQDSFTTQAVARHIRGRGATIGRMGGPRFEGFDARDGEAAIVHPGVAKAWPVRIYSVLNARTTVMS